VFILSKIKIFEKSGFTVFVERKIIGRLHGEAFRHFAAIGGKTYLADTV
jgi:hypothetical protein